MFKHIFTAYFLGMAFSNFAIADTCEAPDPNAPYTLVFEDNFDSDSLDRSKWNTEFLWGPGVVINNEQQYYVNEGQFNYNPFKVADGVLAIQAIKTPFDRTQLYLTHSIYSASSAELLWRTPAGAESYEVYRNNEYIATVLGGSYHETNLRDGIDYAYEVFALNDSGLIISQAQLTINTANRTKPFPNTPFSLALSAKVYSRTSAEIVWQSPNRAARTEIFRNGALYKNLVGKDYKSYYENELTEGERYDYRVVVYDGCDVEIIESTVSLNTGDGVTVLTDEVERLVLDAQIYSKHTAELSWNKVAGAVSYDILKNDVFLENTDARSLFLDNLVPGIDTRVLVNALNADGTLLDGTGRVINTADNSFALNRQPYLSGIITSYDSFKFLYGRVEMRARMPAGQGLWSAFWLLNAYYKQDQPEDPEIDVIEALGHKPNVAHQAYHYFIDSNGDGFHTQRASVENQSYIDDFSDSFHTYSVDWSEGLLVWYVDGVEVKRVTGSSVSNEQMYLLANLAVGGTFPGPADETTTFPAKFEIDYIRVYQQID